MTSNPTGIRTPEELAIEALGDNIDARNWGADGPWAFDGTVLEAASRIRQEITSDEEEGLVAHVGTLDQYYKTLEALREQPGGRNYATARLIVAMYWQLEVIEPVDPDDDLVTDTASLDEIDHGRRHEMY